jgi:hypothetical protein
MLTVECSVVINRPIEQVFTFVANFEQGPPRPAETPSTNV